MDWEWWFTGPTGYWLGFRVQAKIVEFNSFEYRHLHYKNRYSPDYQTDSLIRSALQSPIRRIPIYCLYSNWRARQFLVARHPCGAFINSIRDYGCSIISALVVKDFRFNGEVSKVEALLPTMYPWHCLICQDSQNVKKDDLPHRAWAYWRNVMRPAEPQMLSDLEPDLREIYNEISPTQSPPHYVQQILQGRLVEVPEDLQIVTIFNENTG